VNPFEAANKGGHAMSEMPKVGEPAPEIRLQGIGGKEWSLAAQRGKPVVLLFYVLDWTPG
jgi:peroxiredoxin